MKIIALQGRGNSGKTKTINLLLDILNSNNYKKLETPCKKYKFDFLKVYTSPMGLRIGITSFGDTYDLVFKHLNIFKEENCDICICACKTRDNKYPGTIAATKSFGVEPVYIKKTIENDSSKHSKVNEEDAKIIFSKLKMFA